MKNLLIIFGLVMLFSCKKEMFPVVEKVEASHIACDCPDFIPNCCGITEIVRPTNSFSHDSCIVWDLIDYVSDHSPSFFDSVYADNGRLKITYK